MINFIFMKKKYIFVLLQAFKRFCLDLGKIIISKLDHA